MSVTNIEYHGLWSQTAKDIKAWKFLTQPGFSVNVDSSKRCITITGSVPHALAHGPISAEFAVVGAFAEHVGRNDIALSLKENLPGKPDDFLITLTGSAYGRALEAQHAYMEHESHHDHQQGR